MNKNELEKLKERLLFSDGNLHAYAGITKKEFPELYNEIRTISEREFKIEDAYDRFDETYKYLVCIVEYDTPGELPFEHEIVSFYRYILCKDAKNGDTFDLSTNTFYEYSERFKQILPATIELGRSVVNHNAKTKINGLNAVWRGLGALIDYYKDKGIKFLFGEVSLQKSNYDIEDIQKNDALFSIMACYIKNFYHDDIIRPKEHIKGFELDSLMKIAREKGFTDKSSYEEDVAKLKQILRDDNAPKPRLFFAYGELGKQGSLNVYEFVDNKDVLNCWEMGILMRIDKIDSGWLKHYTKNGYRKEAFM